MILRPLGVGTGAAGSPASKARPRLVHLPAFSNILAMSCYQRERVFHGGVWGGGTLHPGNKLRQEESVASLLIENRGPARLRGLLGLPLSCLPFSSSCFLPPNHVLFQVCTYLGPNQVIPDVLVLQGCQRRGLETSRPLVSGTELQGQREAGGDWGSLPSPLQSLPHSDLHLFSSSVRVLTLHKDLVSAYKKAHSRPFVSLILNIGSILHLEKLRT